MADRIDVEELRAQLKAVIEHAGIPLAMQHLTARILLDILATLVDIKHVLGGVNG